jgi:hypothetical protein
MSKQMDIYHRHPKGIFYQFPAELRQSLLKVPIKDAPSAVSTNREHLDNQRGDDGTKGSAESTGEDH